MSSLEELSSIVVEKRRVRVSGVCVTLCKLDPLPHKKISARYEKDRPIQTVFSDRRRGKYVGGAEDGRRGIVVNNNNNNNNHFRAK